MHPLVDGHEAPPRSDTRPPVYDSAFVRPSRKSWYATTKRWFGIHHHPCGVSSDVEIPSFQHSHHADETAAEPSECGSSYSSDHSSDSSESLDLPVSTEVSEVSPMCYEPTPSPTFYCVPALTQCAGAETTTPFRTFNALKRPREDDEDEPYTIHDTSEYSSSSSLSRSTSPTTDASMGLCLEPCYPEVVSVHGGRTIPTSYTNASNASLMSTYTSLHPLPRRLGSMASLTSFTIDSTRAFNASSDLATLRSAPAEKRALRLAPVPWASSSRCSLEVMSPTPTRAPKLVPAFFPQTSSHSETSSASTSPATSPVAQHRPSPISQSSSSHTPASTRSSAAAMTFQIPNYPPLHHLTVQPHYRPAFPLVYMVTTSEQVQASIASAGVPLSSSLFYYGGIPYYQAPAITPNGFGYMMPTLEIASPEERPPVKKRRRRSHSVVSKSAKISRPEPVIAEVAQPVEGSDAPHDVQPAGSPTLTPPVEPEPNSARTVNIECRWPGCSFSDAPGKLWDHIKGTHGTESTPSSIPDTEQDTTPIPLAPTEDVAASVSPPPDSPIAMPTQGTSLDDALSTSAAVSKMRRSRKSPTGEPFFKRPITCQPLLRNLPDQQAPMSEQAPQTSVPPRPKVWAMGFTDNTVQDGWFVNTTGSSNGISQPGQRKRRRVAPDASESSASNKKSRPPPMPLEESPLFRQCLFIKKDGSLCLHGGTADDVWAHMRTEHGMDKFAVTEPPRIIECGWPGCSEKGTPDDLIKRCETKHKEEAKASVKAQQKDTKSTPAQCRICDAWVRVDGIGRHVDERHWKSNKRTRFCDICGRRERHEKFFSQHHFLFCLDGFMQARPEFRTVR